MFEGLGAKRKFLRKEFKNGSKRKSFCPRRRSPAFSIDPPTTASPLLSAATTLRFQKPFDSSTHRCLTVRTPASPSWNLRDLWICELHEEGWIAMFPYRSSVSGFFWRFWCSSVEFCAIGFAESRSMAFAQIYGPGLGMRSSMKQSLAGIRPSLPLSRVSSLDTMELRIKCFKVPAVRVSNISRRKVIFFISLIFPSCEEILSNSEFSFKKRSQAYWDMAFHLSCWHHLLDACFALPQFTKTIRKYAVRAFTSPTFDVR